MVFDYSLVLPVLNGLRQAVFYFLLGIVVLERHVIMLGLKRRIFRGKGYGYVRVILPDRKEKLDFLNLKNTPFALVKDRAFVADDKDVTFLPDPVEQAKKESRQINVGFNPLKRFIRKREDGSKESFKALIIDPINVTYKDGSDKFPVYTFNASTAKSINFFEKAHGAISSEMFDAIIKRVKAQSNIASVIGQNKRVIMFIMIAAGLAGVSAYFGMEILGMVRDGVTCNIPITG